MREQLEALTNAEIGDEEARTRWGFIREAAPGLWASGQQILETVVAAKIKSDLGL